MTTRKLLAVGLAGLLLAAGCSSSDNAGSSDNSKVAGGPAAPAPAEGGGAAGEKAGADQQNAPQQPGQNAPTFDRAIIYTGQITIRVEHVDQAAEKVRTLATTSDGFVATEKSTSGDGSRDEAHITIRVPAAKFGDILNELGKSLGKELDRNISTQDVTEQVADLDAQIAATRTSVDSVRRLLAQAKDLNQILLLEKELTARQATLDSLVGKKRRLDDQVALSTITVALMGPEAVYVEPKEEDPSFLGGLRAGWETFVVIVQVALAVLGFLIPFLIALALVGVPVIWWLRRKRQPVAGPTE